jgi:hypothetical protein
MFPTTALSCPLVCLSVCLSASESSPAMSQAIRRPEKPQSSMATKGPEPPFIPLRTDTHRRRRGVQDIVQDMCLGHIKCTHQSAHRQPCQQTHDMSLTKRHTHTSTQPYIRYIPRRNYASHFREQPPTPHPQQCSQQERNACLIDSQDSPLGIQSLLAATSGYMVHRRCSCRRSLLPPAARRRRAQG